MGWRITTVVLGVWVIWSLACYEPREDRCEAGQARCDPSGSVTYAENCRTNPTGPNTFDREACYDWAGTCRIGEDSGAGLRRAFCAADDDLDPRCAPGTFVDVCTEDGWLRCADGYASVEALCPWSATCALDAQGAAACGAATEPSPFCAEVDVGYACDGDVTLRCEGGFEVSRWACPATQRCDPDTGRCAAGE
jgi:hypothetical protein